ncbi:unnamed protein product [Mucor hiemalis]
MVEAINHCAFDHPCLSFILDLVDPMWKNLLNEEEIREINSYKRPQMPSVIEDIQSYLNSFDRDAFTSADDLYKHAVLSAISFNFGEDHLKRWVQQSIVNASQLFEFSNESNIEGNSESDLLNLVWQFVYHAFRTGSIQAKLGERTSTSSALGRNEGRSLESSTRRGRKTMGAKVDILFKAGRYELGCCEVGKDNGLPIDDKYLDDGVSKLPKTLRDMLCQLVDANPSKINELYTIDFLMMGLDLELLIVDVPEGCTVARVTRTKKLTFPNKGSNLKLDFLPLLEITLLGRELMSKAAKTVDSRKRRQ